MSSETVRKLVHMGFGVAAVLLRWMTPLQAALFAATALIFNILILPRVGGRFIARSDRGFDRGIILYPVAVLALILVFRNNLMIAGTVWAILAFGDGAATLIGKIIRGPRLSWNPEKSLVGTLAFIEVGLPIGFIISMVIAPVSGPMVAVRFLFVMVTTICCAIVESLPLGIDDNFTVPLVGGALLYALTAAQHLPAHSVDQVTMVWLGIDLLLAVAGLIARSVSIPGAISGFLLGAILIITGGWQLFLVLGLFFIIGSGATKLGYKKKQQLGIAQEAGGRRGVAHAVSNVGVAAICSALIGTGLTSDSLLWLAAAAALVTATTDTLGSEIGQLVGRTAYLPTTLRRVPVGTEGAISLEGTIAGVIGGFLVSGFAALMWAWWSLRGQPLQEVAFKILGQTAKPASLLIAALLMTISGFSGSYLESILGNWNRKYERSLPNGLLNFFNTAVGALLMFILTRK